MGGDGSLTPRTDEAMEVTRADATSPWGTCSLTRSGGPVPFGAERGRSPRDQTRRLPLREIRVVLGLSVAMLLALFLYSKRSLPGKHPIPLLDDFNSLWFLAGFLAALLAGIGLIAVVSSYVSPPIDSAVYRAAYAKEGSRGTRVIAFGAIIFFSMFGLIGRVVAVPLAAKFFPSLGKNWFCGRRSNAAAAYLQP